MCLPCKVMSVLTYEHIFEGNSCILGGVNINDNYGIDV